jgi:hypothetical protein
MEFYGQIAADLDQGLAFGDQGTAYIFVCPSEHEARVFWQCT